jgi:GPH family glycoside/pentoside/hexuronide:cation symporter
MPDMAQRLTRGQHVGYAVGSLGTGGFAAVPGLLLLFYLTDVVGVASALAGLVVLAPKLWDVVIDPVLGSFSDRTMLRRGTRRPWLLLGGLLLPPLFALTFGAPTGLDGNAAAAWTAGFFILAVTAFSVFQVSYLAMPAEITDDYAERTTLMAWRIAFLTLAILVFGAGAPALIDAADTERGGYALMGAVVGALIGVGMLGAWWGTRDTVAHTRGEGEATLAEQVRAIRENRDFAVLLGAFLLQALATGSMLAAAPFVATYILGDESLTTVLFVSLVGPAILVMPIWRWVAMRVGKHRGFIIASLIFLLAAAGLVMMRSLPDAAIYALVGMVGIAYAGVQVFPLAMLPDTLQADASRTGKQRAGVFTGVWTAGETTGFAIGPAVVAGVLTLTGFVSSTGGVTPNQPSTALTGIVMAFSVVPAVLILVSLPVLLRYELTAERLEEIVPT